MATTRKVILYSINVAYLVLLTVLSGYATVRIRQLSLPISRGLAYSTTILPLFAAIILESNHMLTRQRQNKSREENSPLHFPLSVMSHILVIIFSTTTITLLGTYAVPLSDIDCNLRKQWELLFRNKNSEAIRTIQNLLQCCGFRNSRDMAWPFPDKTHAGNACEVAFGRRVSCLEGWEGEEYRLARILMAVVGLVSLWQAGFVLFRARRESWLHQIVPGRVSRMISHQRDRSTESFQRRIAYTSASERYSDRVNVAEDDVENADDASNLLSGSVQTGRINVADGTRREYPASTNT